MGGPTSCLRPVPPTPLFVSYSHTPSTPLETLRPRLLRGTQSITIGVSSSSISQIVVYRSVWTVSPTRSARIFAAGLRQRSYHEGKRATCVVTQPFALDHLNCSEILWVCHAGKYHSLHGLCTKTPILNNFEQILHQNSERLIRLRPPSAWAPPPVAEPHPQAK